MPRTSSVLSTRAGVLVARPRSVCYSRRVSSASAEPGAPTSQLERRLALGLAIAAIVFAGYVRFSNLENNPPGLNQDEASAGVDAYLIWTTGRDAAGARFPIISRSFGDYPPSAYRYVSAPVVGLLGMTPGHHRLGSSVVSFLLVLVATWFARARFGGAAALGVLLSAAACPNWIHLGRYGTEPVLLPFLLITGLAAVERGRDPRHRRWLLAGAVFLGLAAYSYQAAKVLLPLWLIGLLVYLWPFLRELWREGERRWVLGPTVVLIALLVPPAIISFTPEGMARAHDSAGFFHRTPAGFAVLFVTMYAHFMDPRVWFVRGTSGLLMSSPHLGLLGWFDAPFIVLGLASVLLAKASDPARRLRWFCFYWFLVGPTPGAVGFEPDSLTRLVGWYPAPQLIAGLGFSFLVERAQSAGALGTHRFLRAACAAAVTLWLVFAGWLYHQQLVRYPRIAEAPWQFEIGRAIACARELAKESPQTTRVVISPEFAFAATFAQFFFLDFPKDRPAPVIEYAVRTEVRPGELYVFPAHRPYPRGVERCAIRPAEPAGADPVSFVFGG